MQKSRFRYLVSFLLCLGLSACSLDDLIDAGGGGKGLSETEITMGLKSALNVGIDSASSRLSLTDGYWQNAVIKVLLPPDVQEAFAYTETLEQKIAQYDQFGLVSLGLSKVFSFQSFAALRLQLWQSLNRAAEAAAPLSINIFKNAITDISITDGIDILRGDSTAATLYLSGKTYSPLQTAYTPFVDSALAKVNATVLWNQFSTQYNSLLTAFSANSVLTQTLSAAGYQVQLKPLTTDLSTYTTGKALDGLFWAVGQEENRIRKDPIARVTEILKKVFGRD